jgi:hypothetical protein
MRLEGMANKEHLKIIKQGAWAWNAWRDKNPGVQPDLSKADLIAEFPFTIELVRANLRNANLREANLTRADLRMTDLSKADLYGADLYQVDLSGARESS